MKKVLIVEDEKMIRQGIKTMVLRCGIPVEEVLECNNGMMALEILKEQKIDVMFTDIRMPKMDGIQLVKEMQTCENIPLTVAVSGYDDFSYAVEMMRMSVKEYILKPVEREKVKVVMERLENEILKREKEEKEIWSIGVQQLKHWMVREEVKEEKIEWMDSLKSLFFKSSYLVFCKEGGEKKEGSREGIYYFSNRGEEIYIVESVYKEQIIEQELKNTYAGYSNIHEDIYQLHEAYQEAKAARENAFLECSYCVGYEEEEKVEDENMYDVVLLEQIAQMLGTDKLMEAIRIFEKVLWKVKRREISLELFQKEMELLINHILHIYENMIYIEKESLERFSNIISFKNIEEFGQQFCAWMDGFHHQFFEECEECGNKADILKAKEYIEENFQKDLNMAVVSNYVSMNYSLFSIAFKKYTGSNFVNYLRDIRMRKAKELLKDTVLKVTEISRQVGYENEKHFMKTFKNLYGISPTEYRKNMTYEKN